MKQLTLIATMLVGVIVMTSCGPSSNTPEGLTEQMLSLTEECVDVMATIKDEATANAAKGKLEELSKQIKALEPKMKALMDKMTPEEKMALQKTMQEKYMPRIQALMGKMMATMQKLMADPKLKEVLKNIDMPM